MVEISNMIPSYIEKVLIYLYSLQGFWTIIYPVSSLSYNYECAHGH
jgi:hypothetical protein